MPDLVTFIIPTVGRDTLQRAVNSICVQSFRNWHCIVGGDGLAPKAHVGPILNTKFTFLELEHFRHESPVRNLCVACAQTEWVAFLDDDDTISMDYVHWLDYEIKEHDPDVVIFRQTVPLELQRGDAIIPSEPQIVWGNVGVSYAVKRTLASRFPFKQSKHEDLLQLVALEASGAKIHFSSHIAYFGRDHRG